MRIAYDRQIFRWQKYGGISRYFARLACELNRTGDAVRIFEPGMNNGYLAGLEGIQCNTSGLERMADISPYRIKRALRPFLDKVADANIRKWSPDLIHETYYQRENLSPRGIPIVLTVYDMIHELFPEQCEPDDPTSANKRIAVDRADHVICISMSTKRDLIRVFDVDPAKVSVTLLGFDSFNFSELEHLDISENGGAVKPYLLYVGQRRGYKNFSTLLDVYASTVELRSGFDLVAFGGPPFSSDELDRLHELGLSNEQVRHESGGDGLLAVRYKYASAFVYPSLYEGFGLPPLEAMSQGCPVISSNTSSMPEVIGDAAEFFTPTDPEELANSIWKVVGNPAYSAELVKRGSQRIDNFSWQNCALETRAVYQKVCVTR